MEALSSKRFFWNRSFCGLIEMDLCMRLEMHLTQKLGWFEHFNHPDTALSYLLRYIASCLLCSMCFVLFSLLCTEVVRDLTFSIFSRIVLPAARFVRQSQQVEASTNLPIVVTGKTGRRFSANKLGWSIVSRRALDREGLRGGV